ncbi:MAG: metal ABC transporter permease [Rhodospirillaceae bacterium]|nr:metal ABC transporter permease [Rhodospirillaceae bacterium]
MPTWIDDPLFLRPLMAGLALAILGAPLGCLVVWRRIAFFGETLAHVSLPGIAIALIAGLPPFAGAATAGLITALLLALSTRQTGTGMDTVLASLAHVGLSAGLIILSMNGAIRFDPMSLLFGDILALSPSDVGWTVAACLGGGLVLGIVWRRLVFLTLHRDLARVSGLPDRAYDILFLAGLAGYVALAMKLVGVLLVTSLLVIPAAAAQPFSHTPEGAAIKSAAFASGAVLVGLMLSFAWDWPSGPAIVAVGGIFFAAGQLAATRHR